MKYYKSVFLIIIMNLVVNGKENFSYNQPKSRNERISEKINEIISESNIKYWMKEDRVMYMHKKMFLDTSHKYYRLNHNFRKLLKFYGINWKCLKKEHGEFLKIKKDLSEIVLNIDTRNKLLEEGTKTIAIFHNFREEEQPKHNIIGVGIPLVGGIVISVLPTTSVYLSFFDVKTQKNFFTISTSVNVEHPQSIYSIDSEDNFLLNKKLIQILYNEIYKYQKENNKLNYNSNKNKEKGEGKPLKTKVNIFENHRKKRYELSQ